jgi:hypothetical protein
MTNEHVNDPSKEDNLDAMMDAPYFDDPEYQDMYRMWVSSKWGKYFVPELCTDELISLRDVQEYLRRKGLSTKSIKGRVSQGGRLLKRVQEQRSFIEFIPESGWLDAGFHKLNGYDSLFVGKGVTRIVPAKMPCPSYHAIEKLLSISEKSIFRGVFARVFRSFYDRKPIVSPLLVLCGGSHDLRNVLVEMIASLLGGSYESLIPGKEEIQRAYSLERIFRVTKEEDFLSNKEQTYRLLRKHLERSHLRVASTCKSGKDFKIPAFSFVAMLVNSSEECLAAIPNPGVNACAKTIVLKVLEKRVPILDISQAPGYAHELLQDSESHFTDSYFSLEVQRDKFNTSLDAQIFRFLQENYHDVKKVESTIELQNKLKGDGKELIDLRKTSVVNVLRAIARFNPENLQQLNGDQWQLDFTKGEQL